jgi:hypothetical protein
MVPEWTRRQERPARVLGDGAPERTWMPPADIGPYRCEPGETGPSSMRLEGADLGPASWRAWRTKMPSGARRLSTVASVNAAGDSHVPRTTGAML